MSKILDELNSIKVRKHIKTSIEYDCKSKANEDEVFGLVQDILINGLDAFSKITYDLEPAEHKVKVEVFQNR